MILGNVRSLRSKIDELYANVKFLTEYRDANLVCFSEMWLDDMIDSRHLRVDGFGAPIRAGRTEDSGKFSTLFTVFVYLPLSANRACKWVTIHGVTPHDWSLLGTKRD